MCVCETAIGPENAVDYRENHEGALRARSGESNRSDKLDSATTAQPLQQSDRRTLRCCFCLVIGGSPPPTEPPSNIPLCPTPCLCGEPRRRTSWVAG